jgi:hypothetical protein
MKKYFTGFIIGITVLLGVTALAASIGGGGGSSFGNSPVNVLSTTLTSATTTPCVLGNLPATSTPLGFILDITTSTSSAGVVTVGTSTTPYATSTSMIASYTVGANTKATITWTPPYSPSTPAALISPNTYIIVGVTGAGQSLGGYTYGGNCKALLMSAN